MKRRIIFYLAACMTAGVLILLMKKTDAIQQPVTVGPAPEFPAEDWINSEPLSLQALHGKVVLVDFWTFDCRNCYRSFPWLNGLEERSWTPICA
jgi:hypothetical protein